jgi:hypothetical protein
MYIYIGGRSGKDMGDPKGYFNDTVGNNEEKSSPMMNGQSTERSLDEILNEQRKSDKMSENPNDSSGRKNGVFARRNSSVKDKIRELNLKKGLMVSPTALGGSSFKEKNRFDVRSEKDFNLDRIEIESVQDEMSMCSMSINEDQSSCSPENSPGNNDLFNKSLDSIITCNEVDRGEEVIVDTEIIKNDLEVSKIDQNINDKNTLVSDSMPEGLNDIIDDKISSDDPTDSTSSTPFIEELGEPDFSELIIIESNNTEALPSSKFVLAGDSMSGRINDTDTAISSPITEEITETEFSELRTVESEQTDRQGTNKMEVVSPIEDDTDGNGNDGVSFKKVNDENYLDNTDGQEINEIEVLNSDDSEQLIKARKKSIDLEAKLMELEVIIH